MTKKLKLGNKLSEGIIKGTVSMAKSFIINFGKEESGPVFAGEASSKPTSDSALIYIAERDFIGAIFIGAIKLQNLPEDRVLISFWDQTRTEKVKGVLNDFYQKLQLRLAQLGFVDVPPPPKEPIGFKPADN